MINSVPMFGTSHTYVSLGSNDFSQLIPGYYLKLTLYNNSNTAWKVWFFIEMYREQSVMNF
jgi:hypothetical protein